jgi:hypothetical protein
MLMGRAVVSHMEIRDRISISRQSALTNDLGLAHPFNNMCCDIALLNMSLFTFKTSAIHRITRFSDIVHRLDSK